MHCIILAALWLGNQGLAVLVLSYPATMLVLKLITLLLMLLKVLTLCIWNQS